MSKTPLKPEELKCITVHYAELVRHINVEDIIGYLVSKFVLTFDEKNEIQSKATRADKAECLLDKILKPGPDGRFQIFVDSLAQYNELHSNVTSYMDSLRNSQIETATNIASVCGAEGCGTPIAGPRNTFPNREECVTSTSASTSKETIAQLSIDSISKPTRKSQKPLNKLSKEEVEEILLPLLEELQDQTKLKEVLKLTCDSTKPPQIPEWRQKQICILDHTVKNLIEWIEQSKTSIPLDLLVNSLETLVVFIGIRAFKEIEKADKNVSKLFQLLMQNNINPKLIPKNETNINRIYFSLIYYMVERKLKNEEIKVFIGAQKVFNKESNHPNEFIKEVRASLFESFLSMPLRSAGAILELSLQWLEEAMTKKELTLKNGLEVSLLLSVVEKLSTEEYDLMGRQAVDKMKSLIPHFLQSKKSLGNKYALIKSSCMIIICNIFLHDKQAPEFTTKEIEKFLIQCLKDEDERLKLIAAVTTSFVGKTAVVATQKSQTLITELDDKVMKKMCDCLSSSLQDNHNKCFCGLSVRHLMSALEHFLKDSKNFQKVSQDDGFEELKTLEVAVQKQDHSVKEAYQRIMTKLKPKGKGKNLKRKLPMEENTTS